jgi:adenylate cyclase
MIDAQTERMIQEPRLFWHPHFESVLRAAAAGGARAIGMDVAFGLSVEPWAPDLDRQLAAAYAEVSATAPVVFAYDSLTELPEGLPLYLLAGIQGGLGYANLTVDRDNFVRRQELRSQDENAQESLGARLAAVALGAEWSAADGQEQSPRTTLRLGDRAVPLDRSGFMLIRYWGPNGTFRSVSMADVLDAARQGDAGRLEQWFRGNVVLVGATDPTDQRSTPFYLSGDAQQLTTGVEIQASIVATLLEGRFLHETPRTAEFALVALFAFLAAGLAFRFRVPLAPGLLVAIFGTYFAISARELGNGLVLPLVAPLLGTMLGGGGGYVMYSLTEGRNRRLLQDVFGKFVSPAMAQEILSRGSIPMGGTRQPVTVMFCDLRNYTTYCQGHDPQQVVKELNEYFADMTAEIKAHGGMVNKFIGDGIMALFGAPVPHPDDPYNAVVCAQRMVARNREYNRRRKEQGLEPLILGVGIHTGRAVVGTIGAPEKMEYTAIGDAVNVASRIEGENKTFQTQALLSEATYRLIEGRVETERMGEAKLKGVSEPVTLFSVARVE